MSEARFRVVPEDGATTDGGWQYGWIVEQARDGAWTPVLRAAMGGAGCWDISEPDDVDVDYPLHACELDDLIAGLQALRGSEAHRFNVERR
jgi:hypothetical protein